MTSRQLTALGRRYMKRLQMDEWLRRTEFNVVRNLSDDDGNPLFGRSSWHPEERQCWIAVAPGPDDVMSETAIHELPHVILEGHAPVPDTYDEGYEFALNRIAKALWNEWKA